ncbi:MAG TPA: 30S ribosomal protein S5 [Candidatus Saccharimonadia bacterium]|nr:30S ribosomal protein S5 [Candidatus Saccharimonadia bacterium]
MDQEQKVKEFDERVIHIDRVASVAEGGRRFHFRALVAVGDHKGKVGVGVSKGVDVTSAVSKAVGIAKKNFIKIKMYKETIPHEVQYKSGGAVVLIKPAAPGTGLIAGGVIRTILEVGGVRNALSKSLGSNSKINSSRATIAALESLEYSNKWITRIKLDGKKDEPKVELKAPKPEVKKPAIKAKTTKKE